ncbi:MAG: hypothetical protein WCV63_08305 [Negativicutes bacterium]|jgi:hypothetical protein
MKKLLFLVVMTMLVSSIALAAPLTNYSFPHFEADVKVKGLGQVTPSSTIQNYFTNANYNFAYDLGATVGLGAGFAMNAQLTTDKLKTTSNLPTNYSSLEANLMYNVFSAPLLPNLNVFAGVVENFNGDVSLQNVQNNAVANNFGWQAGANVSYNIVLATIYASGAYGNTRLTYEAGLSVPIAMVFSIDAGYKVTQYGGTIDNSANSLTFAGPFVGASFGF